MPLWVRTLLVTARAEEVEAAWPGHLEQLRELRRQGRLRAAGQFRDQQGTLEIFEAEDRLAAEKIARTSPLIDQGLATWMLSEWDELDLG